MLQRFTGSRRQAPSPGTHFGSKCVIEKEPLLHEPMRIPGIRSRRPNVPTLTPHLPAEIVIQILENLLPDVYHLAISFKQRPRLFFRDIPPDFRSVLMETQAGLYAAALVCRSWCPVVNELLYACPFFSSYTRMQMFIRTLTAAPSMGRFMREVWVFNWDGSKLSDPLGLKRKHTRKALGEFMMALRLYSTVGSATVCNYGYAAEEYGYPIDNVLVYGVPVSLRTNILPHVTMYGPCVFLEPWARHPKPSNFSPDQLKMMSIRDIGPSPARLKFAPYFPTSPQLHTLRIAAYEHNDLPLVSSGTFPALRSLEIYRDMFDHSPADDMRPVPVDEACVSKLQKLCIIGREVESAQFAYWAHEGLLCELRHLAVGLLRQREHKFLAQWQFPDNLETLTILVWHCEDPLSRLISLGDAHGLLHSLYYSIQANSDSLTFKTLELRAVSPLPPTVGPLIRDVQKMCELRRFLFKYDVGGVDEWTEARLSQSDLDV